MNKYLTTEYAKIGPPRRLADLEVPQIAPGYQAANFGVAPEALILSARTTEQVPQHIMDVEPNDTALWPALFGAFPRWAWGLQPTGDCTRWMQQHLLDTLSGVLYAAGEIGKPELQCAGEVIYGFAKCELYDSYRYHGAGSTGWAVATASIKYGYLLRKLYEAAGKKWDLSRETDYSVSWGDRGNGVPDALEPFAAEHKAVERLNPSSALECAKLITAGYPTGYCGYTYWPHKRDADGMGESFSSGWHAMALTGVLWEPTGQGAGNPPSRQPYAFWCSNTGHGNHVSGPVGPIAVPDVYAQCGGWVPARLVDRVAAAGDCYAHSLVAGWPVLDLPDWGGGEIF